MDFDNRKVYGDTPITDGLVSVLLLGWLGRWYISLLNIELLLSHTALVVASMYVEDDQALNYEVFKLPCQVHWRVSG